MDQFYILLALITAITWGLSNGFMKVPSLAVGSARAIMLRQATIVIILLVPFLFSLPGLPTFWIALSILLGCYGYIPFYLLCQAMQIAPIGIVNAIGNSFPLIVCILSYFFLGVELTAVKWLGILLTTSGVFILSLFRTRDAKCLNKGEGIVDFKDAKRANVLALGACLLWGVFFTLVQIPNQKIGVIPFVFSAQLGTLISAYLHSLVSRNKRNVGKRTLKISLKAGCLAIVGSLCFYKALAIGNPSIVTGIAGCSPIVGAFFGIYAYKEHLKYPQWIGVGLSIIGVYLLK